MLNDKGVHQGLYHDQLNGVGYLWLNRGVRVYDLDGESGLSFTDHDGMHDLLMACIIKGWRPLTGYECRLIRAGLGMTQPELARAIGSSRSSVARWEGTAILEKIRKGEDQSMIDGNMDALDAARSRTLPPLADRAIRMFAAAMMGLTGMQDLLAQKGFGKRKTSEPRLVLDYDEASGHWNLLESTFGKAGNQQDDPRLGRRFVGMVLTGDPYGPSHDKREVCRVEASDLNEAIALVRTHIVGLDRWHMINYQDVIVAHCDPEITSIPPVAVTASNSRVASPNP